MFRALRLLIKVSSVSQLDLLFLTSGLEMYYGHPFMFFFPTTGPTTKNTVNNDPLDQTGQLIGKPTVQTGP